MPYVMRMSLDSTGTDSSEMESLAMVVYNTL